MPAPLFHENGTLFAPDYQDTYFQPPSEHGNGLAESQHVFLAGNHLPSRFQSLKSAETFTVAELGFGTGLNLLATLQLFQQNASSGARLRFISYEKHPLPAAQLREALQPFWEDIAPEAETLLAVYAPKPGWNHWQLGEACRLSLFIGDAHEGLATQPTQANAWFLDGFNPKHNADLWTESLMQAVFNGTTPNGTFATYTAAGWVRRNLQQAGFVVQRCKGFGRKREMLAGQKTP